jgi:hypothetical protein
LLPKHCPLTNAIAPSPLTDTPGGKLGIVDILGVVGLGTGFVGVGPGLGVLPPQPTFI